MASYTPKGANFLVLRERLNAAGLATENLEGENVSRETVITYLPTQNDEKITSSRSSTSTRPVIRPSETAAARSDSAGISGE